MISTPEILRKVQDQCRICIDTWDKWSNIGFTQWKNHVEVLVPEDNFKAFKCKNISKFIIFVSMFSDGCQILLQKLSKFEQIN